MTPRAGLLEQVATAILAIELPHPTRVAIDGPDAAGKTTFADELVPVISRSGRRAIRASIDGFHRPRRERRARHGDTAEAFYRDSFDHDTLEAQLLLPLGPGGNRRYRRSVFDARTDSLVATTEQLAAANDVLLFDGIFLLRPELRDRWDYRVFLRVDAGETVRRAMARDQALFGSPEQTRVRYLTKYLPGQELYFAEARPEAAAELVIDNTHPEVPVVCEPAAHENGTTSTNRS